MFGEVFTCPCCEFEFCAGWSHHVGGQFLVCRECATYYLAGGGASSWGAKLGEQLKLLRGVYVKSRDCEEYQDTGLTLVVAEVNLSEESIIGLRFHDEKLSHLTCLVCGALGSIVATLNAGDRCPRCKEGKFGEPGSCIY